MGHKFFGQGEPRVDEMLVRVWNGTSWQALNSPAAPLSGQRVMWVGPQSAGTPPEYRPGDIWVKAT